MKGLKIIVDNKVSGDEQANMVMKISHINNKYKITELIGFDGKLVNKKRILDIMLN